MSEHEKSLWCCPEVATFLFVSQHVAQYQIFWIFNYRLCTHRNNIDSSKFLITDEFIAQAYLQGFFDSV